MRRKIPKMLSYISFICLFLLIIDGIIPNLEMLMSGGKILKLIRPKVILFIALILNFLVNVEWEDVKKNFFFPPAVLLCGYFSFLVIYQVFFIGIDFLNALYGIKYYYDFLLIFFLFPFLDRIIRDDVLIKIFKILFIILGLVGLAQIISNSPVLPICSIDGKYRIYSFVFYNNIRPFSLFSLPGSYAFYLCAFISIILIKFRQEKTFLNFILFVFSLLLLYFTYIRSGYVFIFFIFFSFLIYKLGNKYLRYLLILNFVFGLMMVISWSFMADRKLLENYHKDISMLYNNRKVVSDNYLPTEFNFVNFNKVCGNKKDVNIKDENNFIMRLAEWKFSFSLLKKNVWNMFFGTGLLQSIGGESIGFPIDNYYIQIMIHSGVVGLLLVLFFYLKVWIYILNHIDESNYLSSLILYFPSAFAISYFGGYLGSALLYVGFVFFIKENK